MQPEYIYFGLLSGESITDGRSEAVLANVNPILAAKVRPAAGQLVESGTYLLVVSGLGAATEQDALYAQGRNGVPGHIVTKARAGRSMHNYGLAVDIVPYLSGASGDRDFRGNYIYQFPRDMRQTRPDIQRARATQRECDNKALSFKK